LFFRGLKGPHRNMSAIEIVFLAVYFGVLTILALYGSHRYRMAYLYYRHKYALPTPRGRLGCRASPFSCRSTTRCTWSSG
jgi:hypothetical protein